MNLQDMLGGIALMAVLVVVALVVMEIQKKKGNNSAEKQQIKDIIAKQAGAGYTAVFGQRQELVAKAGARSTTRYYYNYAVGFKPENLFIVPLTVENGEVIPTSAFALGKENLGSVEIKDSYTTLLDKNGEQLFKYSVQESNIKMDKHELNIQQKEEAAAYLLFIKEFADIINNQK